MGQLEGSIQVGNHDGLGPMGQGPIESLFDFGFHLEQIAQSAVNTGLGKLAVLMVTVLMIESVGGRESEEGTPSAFKSLQL